MTTSIVPQRRQSYRTFYTLSTAIQENPSGNSLRKMHLKSRQTWRIHLLPASSTVKSHWRQCQGNTQLSPTAPGAQRKRPKLWSMACGLMHLQTLNIPWKASASICNNHKGSETKLLVWTDQVCIDQNNHEEKSRQVALMRQIYHQAENVYVCLSTASNTPALLTSRPVEIASLKHVFHDSLTAIPPELRTTAHTQKTLLCHIT